MQRHAEKGIFIPMRAAGRTPADGVRR